MAQLECGASASSGYLYASVQGSYPGARDAVEGIVAGNGPYQVYVGQRKTADPEGKYEIYRPALFFPDTQDIPPSVGIASAKLSIWLSDKFIDTAFDIVIQNGQPDYPHDPLVIGDYNLAHYSGDGGSAAAGDMSINQYNDIVLNSTGIGWINRDGPTKFILRSSRDIDGNAPSNPSDEYIVFTGAYYADYKAKLTVEYSYDGQPAFLQGGLAGVFGKKGFLLGSLTGQLQYFGWILGNPVMQSFPKKPFIVGDAVTTWGKKRFLQGSLNPYYGRGGYIAGTLTAIPYYPKPIAGSWFQRTASVVEEIS
jgi:hypothetical protein